jgi:(S)-ureidoglycine aminohydrolase
MPETAVRSRGRRGTSFTLLTPANHYASRLPSLKGVRFIKLVTPRLTPALFGEYLLDVPARGARCPLGPQYEHFLYGLGGDACVVSGGEAMHLGDGGFAYVPAGMRYEFEATGAAQVLWLKRVYQRWAGLGLPDPRGGHIKTIDPSSTPVAGLTRRELLDTGEPAFDFNMSLMCFEAGVGLPQIEIHDEEHGLYVTDGGGDYHLDGEQHQVQEGDFIYMAPYCPQGFEAGPDGASYLLYKDVYRDGF